VLTAADMTRKVLDAIRESLAGCGKLELGSDLMTQLSAVLRKSFELFPDASDYQNPGDPR
jgi:uncharacterized protein (DUF2267 family)